LLVRKSPAPRAIVELIKETVPDAARVAILWNPSNPAGEHYIRVLRGAAEKLAVTLSAHAISNPDQLEAAFTVMDVARAQALVVVVDPLIVQYRERVVALAAKSRLPAMKVSFASRSPRAD
jgi:putative tryptophan/tyrosine transport system substrate-binding protein